MPRFNIFLFEIILYNPGNTILVKTNIWQIYLFSKSLFTHSQKGQICAQKICKLVLNVQMWNIAECLKSRIPRPYPLKKF